MSVRYLRAFFTGAGVRGFACPLSSSHLAERALCEWISESFVPARVLGCSLEALQRAVYLCAVRPPAGCGDPVASSLAGRDIGGCGFFSFLPQGSGSPYETVRDHAGPARVSRSASPRRASPAPPRRGYVGSEL